MMAYFLGVDTGATKSEAAIADSRGQVLGYGRSGPGNWETVGWEGTRAVLAEIIGRAAAAAGIGIEDVTAAGLGLAGYDWPEDHAPHMAILHDIGLRGPTTLVNDAVLGLIAGAEAGWGVVISAGTSCNCYGRDAAGRYGRMTGDSRFGEYAGATELVQYAIQAVARAWSKRGPETQLSTSFAGAVGAKDVGDLLAGLVRGRYTLDAGYAPLVFEAAAAGDAVAGEAVDWAGRQLAELGLGVIRQLNLGDQSFDVVLSGSFYRGSSRLQTRIAGVITAEAPAARIVRLAAPPVTGGVLLAMEADRAPSAAVRALLHESVSQISAG
jgi:N-acetylglucosamine kinase-like BadF-type ATPase